MTYCEVATSSQTFMNGTKIGSSSVSGITGELNKVFEPIDSFKGDMARSFFYFITRYEDDMATWPANTTAAQAFDYNTFPSVTIPFLQMMLRWHHLDPVSTREKTRNNGAYTFQGNRNPYVDHPEYVDSVWNANCPGLAILPVDITYFSGKVNGDNLNLNWEVNTEINLSHYEIEKSFNGTSYNVVETHLGKGFHSYSYNEPTDNIKGKRVYYRIKKVDKDGKFSYSEVFTIHLPLNPKITVYPNPAKDFIIIDCKNAKELFITDYVGRTIKQINNPIEHQTIDIKQFSNGTYFVKLIVDGEPLVARFVVEK